LRKKQQSFRIGYSILASLLATCLLALFVYRWNIDWALISVVWLTEEYGNFYNHEIIHDTQVLSRSVVTNVKRLTSGHSRGIGNAGKSLKILLTRSISIIGHKYIENAYSTYMRDGTNFTAVAMVTICRGLHHGSA
jgi:hypothetical protein